jgi:hypothetical protein
VKLRAQCVDTSEWSRALCNVEKSWSSTGYCCPDTSRCHSGPWRGNLSMCSTGIQGKLRPLCVDRSEYRTGLCSVDNSRSSTGYCCPDTSRYSSGPSGIDVDMSGSLESGSSNISQGPALSQTCGSIILYGACIQNN